MQQAGAKLVQLLIHEVELRNGVPAFTVWSEQMREWHVKLGPGGQLTIPEPAQEELDLHAEDTVIIALVDDELRLRPGRSRLLRGFGSVKPMTQPEHFDEIREVVEQMIATEVARECGP